MPNLYNVNDGPTGRTGGPYLDRVEAAEAEEARAAKESRAAESTLQPYAGIELDTARGVLFRQPIEATRIVAEDDAEGAVTSPVVETV